MTRPRFRLRTLMSLVALAAVGLGVAMTIRRYWIALSMLRSEPDAALLHYHAAPALPVVAALALIVIGVIVLAVRLRVVLRASSPGSGRNRP